MKLLVARGANVNMKDSAGRTALGFAAEGQHGACVVLLPANADPVPCNTVFILFYFILFYFILF